MSKGLEIRCLGDGANSSTTNLSYKLVTTSGNNCKLKTPIPFSSLQACQEQTPIVYTSTWLMAKELQNLRHF